MRALHSGAIDMSLKTRHIFSMMQSDFCLLPSHIYSGDNESLIDAL